MAAGSGGAGASIERKELTLTTAPTAGSGGHATIDCGGAGRALTMQDANVTLSGLHLRSGNATEGGLLYEAGGRLAERYGRDPNSAALSRDSAVIASLTYSF